MLSSHMKNGSEAMGKLEKWARGILQVTQKDRPSGFQHKRLSRETLLSCIQPNQGSRRSSNIEQNSESFFRKQSTAISACVNRLRTLFFDSQTPINLISTRNISDFLKSAINYPRIIYESWEIFSVRSHFSRSNREFR